MTSLPATRPSQAPALLLLAAVTWVADFWHHAGFGLYEDDWARIPGAVELAWGELLPFLLTRTYGQGRPLHDGLIVLLSFLGIKAGGLQVVYWIAWAIVTTNAFLFHRLLLRTYRGAGFALAGALAFCLFPADTTRHFLTHSLGVQPSLTFLLLALNAWVAGRTRLSYAIGTLSLFCYEPVFPVFLAAPLLATEWDAGLFRRLRRHVLLLGSIVLAVAVLRRLLHEHQISQFGALQVALLAGNPLIGPLTSLAMYAWRPIQALLGASREMAVLVPLSFAAMAWALLRSGLGEPLPPFALDAPWKGRLVGRLRAPDWATDLVRPALTGLVMLPLAYLLTLSSLGFSVAGRGTRVHAGAVVGGSLLFACVATFAVRAAARRGRARLATLGLAAFLALLVGFGLTVQRDYVAAWQYQRMFFSDLVALAPDMGDGTAILVEPTGLTDNRQLLSIRKELDGKPDTRQIKFLENLADVLPAIYRFPDDWKEPPRVYRMPTRWKERILSERGRLQTLGIGEEGKASPRREVDGSDVILLETGQGRLARRGEPLDVGGRTFDLRPAPPPGPPPWARRRFHAYLIRGSGEAPADYLAR